MPSDNKTAFDVLVFFNENIVHFVFVAGGNCQVTWAPRALSHPLHLQGVECLRSPQTESGVRIPKHNRALLELQGYAAIIEIILLHCFGDLLRDLSLSLDESSPAKVHNFFNHNKF
jgi:hypothetical protein